MALIEGSLLFQSISDCLKDKSLQLKNTFSQFFHVQKWQLSRQIKVLPHGAFMNTFTSHNDTDQKRTRG